MLSISNSSSLSITSGGGSVKFGPCTSFSRNEDSSVAWKLGWIFHCLGSLREYVMAEMTFSMTKGPYRFGASFFDGTGTMRFFADSHTLSPFFHGINLEWKVLSAIRRAAMLWHAWASSRIFWSLLICSSTAGTGEVDSVDGSARGS